MTDADMTRPEADDHPKDPSHTPAVKPMEPGDAVEGSEDEQSSHDDPDDPDDEVEQTGGKVANPYTE